MRTSSSPDSARRSRTKPVAAAGLLLALAASCSSPIPNRDPVGEPFPDVTGRSLEDEEVRLPEAYAGSPLVLLVGYKQRSQFDLDRWLMGLLQAEVDAPILELPTIPALVPTLISGWIDQGMRSGIPPQDWGAVVTLYGDSAEPVAELTGTEDGQRARVLLLDGSGQVVWFDDQGYSARAALELAERVRALRGTE